MHSSDTKPYQLLGRKMGQDSTVRAAVGVFGKEKGQALITTEVTDKSK